MNSSKAQSMFMIGVALVLMSGIILYVSLSSPAVYMQEVTTQGEAQTVSQSVAEPQDDTASASTTTYTEPQPTASFPININTATVEELCLIDGMGEARASAIVEYREYIGGYESVDQIMNISGIGESLYAKLSPYLTV
ncbi:ComEA family DNA-binding protein [Eubacterium sp.]|uniref:ComEA family DNA-binding protein n=1 Tax=Eubacterium sp. TaxID=142586 RepID=UPI003F0F2AF6